MPHFAFTFTKLNAIRYARRVQPEVHPHLLRGIPLPKPILYLCMPTGPDIKNTLVRAAQACHGVECTLKPSARRHCLCASILAAQLSSPCCTTHSSRAVRVSGHAQQMRHEGSLGATGAASSRPSSCFSIVVRKTLLGVATIVATAESESVGLLSTQYEPCQSNLAALVTRGDERACLATATLACEAYDYLKDEPGPLQRALAGCRAGSQSSCRQRCGYICLRFPRL